MCHYEKQYLLKESFTEIVNNVTIIKYTNNLSPPIIDHNITRMEIQALVWARWKVKPVNRKTQNNNDMYMPMEITILIRDRPEKCGGAKGVTV